MLRSTPNTSVSSWDGTVSPSEFEVAAQALAEKWKMIDHDLPLWSWIPCEKSPLFSSHEVSGYLSLEKVCLSRPLDKENDEDLGNARSEVSSFLKNEYFIDSAVLVHESDIEIHHFDFHIVYSNSYRVPVMYFRGYHTGGEPLLMDDIEMDLPASSAKVLQESKWTFLTEQEHPHLSRPWYTLHPCGTNELMKLLFQSNTRTPKDRVTAEQYLISWLSVVGQVVGLRVPLQMVVSRLPQRWTDC